MTQRGVSRKWVLFQPEEVAWRELNRPVAGGRAYALSLKAAFWCAAAIGISLVIGNLL
jgi:hypothetical protein